MNITRTKNNIRNTYRSITGHEGEQLGYNRMTRQLLQRDNL